MSMASDGHCASAGAVISRIILFWDTVVALAPAVTHACQKIKLIKCELNKSTRQQQRKTCWGMHTLTTIV